MKKYYNFSNQKDLKFKIKKHYNKNQYSKKNASYNRCEPGESLGFDPKLR